MSGTEPTSVETVIDNGKHGTRTIRFETGQLAQQAAGSAVAYLDEETMLLSATTVVYADPSRSAWRIDIQAMLDANFPILVSRLGRTGTCRANP